MTSMHDLPVEILLQIFKHTRPELSSQLFFLLALVHTTWTAPVLEILYRNLTIHNRGNQAMKLGRGAAAKGNLVHTRTVVLHHCVWIHEVELILRSCVSLKTLVLQRSVKAVPRNVLQYPSLQNLESLTLHCVFDPWTQTAGNGEPFSQLARLKNLQIELWEDGAPVYPTILSSFPTDPSQALRSLTVSHGYNHLHMFIPLAPNLTFFDADFISQASVNCVEEFLEHASHLTDLRMEVPYAADVARVLGSLTCQLRTLDLYISSSDKENVNGSCTVLRKWLELKAVKGVEWIKFGSPISTSVWKKEGYRELVTVMSKNDTRLID